MKVRLILIIFIISSSLFAQETINNRISVPQGYTRTSLSQNSFGYFLRNLELLPKGSPVLDYRGEQIYNQEDHLAIINYDVGKRNLQQCADAVIRLRAEYLWKEKKYDEIIFHFTSGDAYSWNDYKNGIRPKVNGNKVEFIKTADIDSSYQSFRRYLDRIYMYAGTISINREMETVKISEEIQIGDVIVTAGSPGHAVIIVDEAQNENGDKIFLLAQGFMPAQSIHVIKNKEDLNLSNWYTINNKEETLTAGYDFYNTNIKRFK